MSTFTTLKELEVFAPVTDKSNGDVNSLRYTKEPIDDYILTTNYSHFPVCLNEDGSIWVHGTLYLLSKLSGIKLPDHQYLASIAQDLNAFRNWCDSEEDINYQEFPKRKVFRPTYAYHIYLLEQIKDQKIAVSTAKRRMSSTTGFYRWYSTQHDANFDKKLLWQDREMSIGFKDSAGFIQSKQVHSTDTAIQGSAKQSIEMDCIQDGGSLRPLNKIEQEILFKGLFATNNTEMILSFLVAITTGARLQTIFTVKKKHIIPDIEDALELPIQTGMGTGINTKNNKQLTIFIPFWLQRQLKIYCESPRWKKRNLNSTGAYEDDENYLFLTRTGRPYYASKEDTSMKSYKYPPKGEAIWDFIAKKLSDVIHSQGNYLKFRFHDLRATYGLNLLNERINASLSKNPDLMSALNYVRERMGHSDIIITKRYLQYKDDKAIATKVQSEFEEYLIDLMGGVEIQD